jgi:competence ComEA-like helix-hairpin-helix protein
MHIALLAALLCATPDPLRPPLDRDKPPAVAGQPAKVRKKTAKPAMTGVLNLNRATEAELRLLPGIGKRKAQLIVERREKKPFKTVEEVGRIKGMRALVERLRARLVVEGDTTLRPARP